MLSRDSINERDYKVHSKSKPKENPQIADRHSPTMNNDEIIAKGRRCIDIEAEALRQTSAHLGEDFAQVATAVFKVLNDGKKLIYNYNVDLSDSKISEILLAIRSEQIQINDVHTEQSSLEDIFIELVTEG